MATDEQIERMYAKCGMNRDAMPRPVGEIEANGKVHRVYPVQPAMYGPGDVPVYFTEVRKDPIDILYPKGGLQ